MELNGQKVEILMQEEDLALELEHQLLLYISEEIRQDLINLLVMNNGMELHGQKLEILTQPKEILLLQEQ